MNRTRPLVSSKTANFAGTARIPGDKSISHRALMLGLVAEGETMISGLLEGDDVMCTADAVRALGGKVQGGSDGLWRVFGLGGAPLRAPDNVLDMGNSGTSTRLLAGLVAGYPVAATFTGDASLRKRPMKRITDPLGLMGAQFIGREGGRLPLSVQGAAKPLAIEYTLPVASAQVKSAILLAGLRAEGTTKITEPRPTRDHTEKMLQHFSVDVAAKKIGDGGMEIALKGGQRLLGCAIDVPADPSSAAFPVVAACLIAGAKIKLPGICMNERRTGIYQTLAEMGAVIEYKNKRSQSGEQVADIHISGDGKLRGIAVPEDRVPDMIDEIPVLAVAAACAEGTTHFSGLAELRVKESDRLKMIAAGLTACGVTLEEGPDSLVIHGNGKPPAGGAVVETAMDHRIAMSFLVLGMVSAQPVEIDDAGHIDTSFPGFTALMNRLGARIDEVATDRMLRHVLQ